MSQKKIILVLVAIVAVLALAIGGLVLFSHGTAIKPTGTAKPATTSSPGIANTPGTSLATNKTLTKTTQYQSIFSSDNLYNPYLNNGTLNKLSANPALVDLSVYTMDKYIQGAVVNPYFTTNWWGTKDSYAASSLETYVTPYLSKDYAATYLKNSVNPTSPAGQAFLKNKLFLPEGGLTVPQQCYDSWNKDYCYSTPYTIDSMSFNGTSATTVEIKVAITINPIYQKPNTPDGNQVVQPRHYNMTFDLARTNEPTSLTTKVPIMEITNISSSSTLVIDQQQDYLINNPN